MERRPTRLVLVRHGEANVAVEGVVGGHDGCTGLSPLGRTQAERLRDRLARTKEIVADVLVSSVLPRAVETAQIIAPALGIDAPIDQRCDLCELHPGESDGLTWEQYRDRYGTVDMWRDVTTPMAPGGESLTAFRARVGRALEALADEHEGRTVVAACHGGVMMASVSLFLGVAADRRPIAEVWVDNTGITEWVRREDGRWRLVRHNDAAHLLDLAG